MYVGLVCFSVPWPVMVLRDQTVCVCVDNPETPLNAPPSVLALLFPKCFQCKSQDDNHWETRKCLLSVPLMWQFAYVLPKGSTKCTWMFIAVKHPLPPKKQTKPM